MGGPFGNSVRGGGQIVVKKDFLLVTKLLIILKHLISKFSLRDFYVFIILLLVKMVVFYLLCDICDGSSIRHEGSRQAELVTR